MLWAAPAAAPSAARSRAVGSSMNGLCAEAVPRPTVIAGQLNLQWTQMKTDSSVVTTVLVYWRAMYMRAHPNSSRDRRH